MTGSTDKPEIWCRIDVTVSSTPEGREIMLFNQNKMCLEGNVQREVYLMRLKIVQTLIDEGLLFGCSIGLFKAEVRKLSTAEMKFPIRDS